MYSHFHADFHHPHAEPPTAVHDTHQRHGTDLIGRPILFVSGQFAGQTIRAELSEVQQADLGRKYARVDRRPLDPPPVVCLRLFEVYNTGTDEQLEKEVRNYEDIQALGLLCTVDLFPIPSSHNHGKPQRVQSVPPGQGSFPYSPGSPSRSPPDSRQHSFAFGPSQDYTMDHTLDNSITPSPTRSATPLHPQSPTRADSDIVHYFQDQYPIRESSKMTSSLVGATFVQPAIVEFQGKKSIMFVFADLAVKVEGSFILRYRIFDIFSKPFNYGNLAIQAECYGGAFRVYSTKEFPGLQASTELTKQERPPQQLARWGVRLNTRETERKRRKKGEARSASPLYTGARKRKLPSSLHGGEHYETDDD